MADVRVLESLRLSPTVHSLALETPEAQRAAPGMFLHLACGPGLLLRRPISICDRKGDALRVVFEIKGEGTQRLAELKAGDRVDALGPLGHGFSPEAGKRVLLVGGGLGAAPLLLAARTWDCDALLGFASADKVILAAQFAAACGSVGLSTDDGSLGYHGFVTELAKRALQKTDYTVLACGPEPMLRVLAGVCKEAGASLQVSLERRMGCGVGACLVCACKKTDGSYARACADGPVFDAGEVDWNG